MTRVPPETAQAAAAVLGGAHTVRAVGVVCGWGPSIAYGHLLHARHLGLVTWVRGKSGTLRPAVTIVAQG